MTLDMTYNVFGGTLNLALSIYLTSITLLDGYHINSCMLLS